MQNTPQFIKQVPWYAAKQGKSTSNSQSKAATNFQNQQWYDRGSKGFQASTFRKGACQNCGAMGHNKKQCTERPRKISAKYSVKNIAADDLTKDLSLNWQGKRDRWNGYDANMYKQVIQQYQQFQQIRKRVKQQQGEQDVDKQYKHSDDPIQLSSLPTKHAKNQKYQGLGGVRNKDDVAKYLKNLGEGSDYFDPKSRAMKSYDNQFNNLDTIGQKQQLLHQDRFAAEQVQLHNSELSSVALPTLTEKIYKKIKQNNQNSNLSSKSKQIMKKYGDLQNVLGTNSYIDVIQQDQDEEQKINNYKSKIQKVVAKTKYQQDVYINDHTTVWGSWYNKHLGWGYACCNSTQKMSYCLGNKGKQKALAAELKAKAHKLRQLKQLQQASNKQPQAQNLQDNKKIEPNSKQISDKQNEANIQHLSNTNEKNEK